MSITQGGAYVGYANGYLSVLQLFDQTTKEIVVEVTDKAGLTYTETFEIKMAERPTAPTPTPEDTPPPQDDESEEDVDPNKDSDGDGVPDDQDKHPDNPFLA